MLKWEDRISCLDNCRSKISNYLLYHSHSHPFKDNKIDSAHTKKGLNFKP